MVAETDIILNSSNAVEMCKNMPNIDDSCPAVKGKKL